jgi:preprotein translocase subunit SecE
MAKEKNAAFSPFLRELVQLGIYKRNQGRVARQVTFAVLVVGFLLGAWRSSVFGMSAGPVEQYLLPSLLAVAGAWFAYRLVNMPNFADFLIAVEAEMNKVSWPTRGELLRSSLVVIFCIFFLAAVLFGYDLFWRTLLHVLKVIDVQS